MKKIKDLSKVILSNGMMLGELITPKRMIIAPDGSRDEDSYIKVLVVASDVKDMKPGDIVIKYGGSMTGYMVDGIHYTVMHRGAVLIGVDSDNFIDPDVQVESVSV